MLTVLLTMVCVCVLAYGLYTDQRFWLLIAAGAAGAWLLSLIVFFFRRSSSGCPLCMVPLWGSQKCQKSSKVKPALGVSYRLGVSSSIIFRGHYRCPYCGEPFNAREARK